MPLNLISSIIVFVAQIAINFFLTPYILRVLGNEAYGFLGLANSVVGYANIFTVIINSVASRFVSYEFHKGNIEGANRYYSSILMANIFFSFFICLISIFFIFNIKEFLNVSPHLENDFKLTITFYFINTCILLFNGVLSIFVFIKNKLYLISIRNAISTLIYATLVMILFFIFKPMIYYTSISALSSSVFVLICSMVIAKKISPELEFKYSYFSFKTIKKLLNSGIWNSVNVISYNLINGVDLLLCNIFISPASMGILSVSKMVPFIMESFMWTIVSTFLPKSIEAYSKDDIPELIAQTKFSIKILAFIAGIPVLIFVVFGFDFYSLWLSFKSKEEIKLIYTLSLLASIPVIFIAIICPLFNLNIITNKLKRPAMANLIMGIGIFILQIIMLKFSSYGLVAMVIISCFGYMLKIILFDIANAGINVERKFTEFYGFFLKNILFFVIVLVILLIFKEFLLLNTWLKFIFHMVLIAFISYIISFILIFNQFEKRILIDKIKKIINFKI